MDEKQILRSVSDTVVSKHITVEVDILQKTWIDKLKKREKRVFDISPITLGSLYKISKELIDINITDFNPNTMLESNYSLILNNAERMARIVAYAVVNTRKDPPQSLINFFLDNLTSKELYKIASIVLKSMDINSFMFSIFSIRSANVLTEKSPETGETIAPGKQSAA